MTIFQRASIALLTAALTFAITCAASWVAMRDPGTMEYATIGRLRSKLHFAHEALVRYEDVHGEYPTTLGELDIPAEQIDQVTRDPWGNPLEYSKSDDAFKLASLGRDGKPGGQGLDADVYSEQAAGSRTRLPLSQFLFQTKGSKVVLCVAVLAGLCAGAVSYVSTAPRKSQATSGASVIGNFVVQIISAAVVAVILSFLYVATSQSGH